MMHLCSMPYSHMSLSNVTYTGNVKQDLELHAVRRILIVELPAQ